MHDSNVQNDSQSYNSEAYRCINREFIKSAPDPICLFDLDYRIVMLNEKATKLFGLQPESFFIGKSILDFILPENHPQVLECIKNCLNTNLIRQSKYLIRTDNGTALPVKTTSFILSNRADRPIALLSLVRDASDRKAEDINIESAQRAQLYLDLLGHDISNKLQVIMSSAELLRDSIRNPFESRLIQNIIDSVSSCKRIIYGTEILEHYKNRPMRDQHLDTIVKTALLGLIKSRDDITVHANIQVCDATILCDEYITCLLSNILDNAWIHNTCDDKQVWVTLSKDLNGYLLSICDNGPGIISDRKNNGACLEKRSSGIGLFICHALIEKYQGWIQITDRIKDQPDQGTQVVIWLPQHQKPLEQD
jgi:PAS domain S-box-containing protein